MTAGLGTRLKPFSLMEPKPLLPVMGVPILQFAFDQLKTAGVKSAVYNVHSLPEKMRKGVQQLDRAGFELSESDETPLLLGSAGGLKKALPRLNHEPFFLLNGDVLAQVDLNALARQHARLRERWGVHLTLTLFRSGPRGGKYREIFFDSKSSLMTHYGDLQEGRPYFASVAIIEPEALDFVPEGVPSEFLPAILDPALKQNKVGVYLAEGDWFDIGSPTLWLNAHIRLIEGLETGCIPDLWRKRIQSKAHRISHSIWSSGVTRAFPDWAGPIFMDPSNSTGEFPRQMGPNCVLYGIPQDQKSLSNGIGFKNVWQSCSEG